MPVTPADAAEVAATTETTETTETTRWRELVLLVVLAVIWSASFTFIKVAVATVPPVTVTAGRMITAAVVMVLFARLAGHRLPWDRRSWTVFAMVGLLGSVLPFSLIHFGETEIDSGLAAILMGIMPATTAVLAHLFTPDDRLTRRRVAGVAVGFAGLIGLVGFDALRGMGGAALAELAVLGGAVSYAVAAVYTRRAARQPGPVMAAGATVSGTLMVIPLAFVLERPMAVQPSGEALLSIAFLGVLGTGFATLLYFRLVRTLGPTVFSQVNFMIPILGVVWGTVFLHERLDMRAAVAMACILAGIWLVTRSGGRTAAAKPD